MAISTLFSQDKSALGIKASVTWNKSAYISQDHWEEKELAATLSDTEPENDSDNEDDGILNAFTATVNPT